MTTQRRGSVILAVLTIVAISGLTWEFRRSTGQDEARSSAGGMPGGTEARDHAAAANDTSPVMNDAKTGMPGKQEQAEQKGVFRTPDGAVALHLEQSAQHMAGIKTKALATATWRPERVGFGVIQEDPSAAFTVRAPVAGVVSVQGDRAWPGLGTRLEQGETVGAIEPRVVPIERIDLVSRLGAAHADVATTIASLEAARSAYQRAKKLNLDGKIVSDSVLQDAEVVMKSLHAKLQAAQDNERLIAASTKSAAGPTGPLAMQVDRGGEVVAVTAQPGESVESGQAILQLAQFDTVLARIVLPPDEPLVSQDRNVTLVVLGNKDHPLKGERIASVSVDPRTQGETFLVKVHADGFSLRPGQAVTAYLPIGGAPRIGVFVPREAVVRYSGSTLVFVKTESETFEQREMVTDFPMDSGWFVADGLKPGERIVTVGAQTVLSEVFKSQIPAAEAGEAPGSEEREAHEHGK